jgi:hypothetical protein
MKLVFLLEEPSMKHLLDILLPRILPSDVDFQTIPHSGKRALERSIPIKLRAWNEPGEIKFVIVHDQDNKDCILLKKQLLQLCSDTNRQVLVRIACQEMEAWYLGDFNALSKAYNKPKLLNFAKKSKYRYPDDIPAPKEELRKIVPEYQQILGAKTVGPFMDIENNTSVSFQQFVTGVRRIVNE